MIFFQTQAATKVPHSTDFLVTLQDGLQPVQIEKCVEKICRYSEATGTGDCEFFDLIGVVGANISDSAARRISKLKCVRAVERSQILYPNPRVGREN